MKNKTLHPIPPKNIILNNEEYKYSTLEKCQTIYGVHYCPQEELLPIQETCIPAIINLQKAICNTTKIQWETSIIPIDENTIFIEPGPTSVEFSSNCTRKSNKIQQTSLITYSECFLTFGNIKFQAFQPRNFTDILETLPWNEIQIQHTLPELNLLDIHNWTITNIEELHQHHKGFKMHTSLNYTSLGISLCFLLILIVIIYKLRIYILPKRVFQSLRNRKPHLSGEELYTRQQPEVNITPKPESPEITMRTKEAL